jgi:hypothetical protein
MKPKWVHSLADCLQDLQVSTKTIIEFLTYLIQVNYPSLFSPTGIWGTYPYLMCNLVGALITLAGFVSCWLYLTESHKGKLLKSGYNKLQHKDFLPENEDHEQLEVIGEEGDTKVVEMSAYKSSSLESISLGGDSAVIGTWM